MVLLTFRLLHNRSLVRISAGLVAVLYLFLCTLGALTHVHALVGVEAEESSSDTVAVQNVLSPLSRNASTHLLKGMASPSTHCAYCDWQANSLSAAIVPQRLILPQSNVYEAPPFLITLTSRALPRSSSRAPPIA